MEEDGSHQGRREGDHRFSLNCAPALGATEMCPTSVVATLGADALQWAQRAIDGKSLHSEIVRDKTYQKTKCSGDDHRRSKLVLVLENFGLMRPRRDP